MKRIRLSKIKNFKDLHPVIALRLKNIKKGVSDKKAMNVRSIIMDGTL